MNLKIYEDVGQNIVSGCTTNTAVCGIEQSEAELARALEQNIQMHEIWKYRLDIQK